MHRLEAKEQLLIIIDFMCAIYVSICEENGQFSIIMLSQMSGHAITSITLTQDKFKTLISCFITMKKQNKRRIVEPFFRAKSHCLSLDERSKASKTPII